MRGKKRYIKLTETQRQALQKGFEKGKSGVFRKRCHMILLSAQGFGIQQISALYQLSRMRVGYWFDRYEQGGVEALKTNRGQGRPPILRIDNEADVNEVEHLVDQNAQNLKPALAELERKGKPMSKRTLQRFLKKLDDVGNDFEEVL